MSPVLLLAALVLELSGGEPATAEYAFRWNPSEGGPASMEDVQRILGGKTKSTKEFAVRYHRIAHDKKWPNDADAVFRVRSRTEGDTEFRLKLRSATPFEMIEVCPDGMEFSYEKDVTFKGNGAVRKIYSISCSGTDPSITAALKTTPLNCQSTFTRFDTKKYRLEAWKLPNQTSLLEISRKAPNTASDQADFGFLVDKMLQAGAKPTTESKTELGQNCTE